MAVAGILMGGYVIVPDTFIFTAYKFCKKTGEWNLASVEFVEISS
jgi:hypothetical protein